VLVTATAAGGCFVEAPPPATANNPPPAATAQPTTGPAVGAPTVQAKDPTNVPPPSKE
jgi:hypothetical protein